MTENELRETVCRTARAWLGRREDDGSHREIIDVYNRISPLPRGYRMTYQDPWCAAFVSAVGEKAGLGKILFPECACDPMIARYQEAGRFEEQDFAVPRPGDLIFYDWEDSGAGDCRGSSDHVGLVLSVKGNLLKVIEGNKSDAVGLRDINIDARFIRGYGLPDYARWAETAQTPVDGKEGEVTIIIDPPEEETEGDAKPAAKPLVTGLPVLRKGDKGEVVRAAQLLLNGRYCSCGMWGADGDFGPQTKSAVLAFQRRNGLEADGIIGPNTWAKLLGL